MLAFAEALCCAAALQIHVCFKTSPLRSSSSRSLTLSALAPLNKYTYLWHQVCILSYASRRFRRAEMMHRAVETNWRSKCPSPNYPRCEFDCGYICSRAVSI